MTIQEAMPGLPVCIVSYIIKEGNALKLIGVAATEGEVVSRGIGINIELKASNTIGAFPHDGRGDDMPGEALAYQVGSVFSAIEGPVGEIPEGTLPPTWLIDG
jgi:hypothetical protein